MNERYNKTQPSWEKFRFLCCWLGVS